MEGNADHCEPRHAWRGDLGAGCPERLPYGGGMREVPWWGVVSSAVLLALVIWFAAELVTGSGQAGLAERTAGTAQALWPLAVVLSCRRPLRATSGPSPAPVACPADPGTR